MQRFRFSLFYVANSGKQMLKGDFMHDCFKSDVFNPPFFPTRFIEEVSKSTRKKHRISTVCHGREEISILMLIFSCVYVSMQAVSICCTIQIRLSFSRCCCLIDSVSIYFDGRFLMHHSKIPAKLPVSIGCSSLKRIDFLNSDQNILINYSE